MFKNWFKKSDIEKEYSKSDRRVLDELTETLLTDIDTYISNIDRTIDNLNKTVYKIGGYEVLQDFIVNKLNQNIDILKECKTNLLKIKKYTKIKIRYIKEIYNTFSLVNSCISSLKDMQYSLKDYIRKEKDNAQ